MPDPNDLGFLQKLELMVPVTDEDVAAVGISPLGDRVLLVQDAEPDRIGSIVIARTEGSEPAEPQSGRVCGIGPDYLESLSIGDRVVYDHWHGEQAEFEGRTLRLMDADEVLAVLE